MKRFLVFLLVVFAFLGAFVGYPTYLKSSESNSFEITSPLPNFLTGTFPKVLGTETGYWKPDKSVPALSPVKLPHLTAQAALAYDLTTNKALFARNADKRLPMASLTKIMTAALALQNYKLYDEFTVTESASTIGENTMGLTTGEVLTLNELLCGLVLVSGNDAAETIAQGSEFGRDNFVYLMNKKAEELGLTNTRFTNPSGLEGDGNQYSTAYDLVVMTRFALENDDFARVVETYEYDIPANDKHKEFHFYNETNLLTSYPGVKGVKTGYTYEAGLCLVTYLEYKDHKIISVILNAQNRRQEMKDLLDYSLKTLGVEPPPHS